MRTRSGTSEAGSLALAKLIGFGFSFVLPFFLVRLLDQTQFGIYKQAFLLVSTLTRILPFGWAASLYYFLPRDPARQRQVIANTVAYHLICALTVAATLIAYRELVGRLLGWELAVRHIHLIAVIVGLSLISGLLESAAMAQADLLYATLAIVAAQASRSILMLGAVFVFRTIDALLWAAIFQGIVQSGAMLWYFQKRFPGWSHAFSSSVAREQCRYALPLGFASLALPLQTELHFYVVASAVPASVFAIYSIGCFQVPLVGLLRDSVFAVLSRRMSEMAVHGKTQEMAGLFLTAVRKLALVYMPVFVLFLVIGRRFLTVLFTEQYESSWPVFAINLGLLPVAILITDPLLRASESTMRLATVVRLSFTAAMVCSLPASLQTFGLTGPIAAVVLFSALERLTTTVLVVRITPITFPTFVARTHLARITAAVACAGAAAALIQHALSTAPDIVVLCITATLFLMIYAALLCFSGALTSDDLTTLWRVSRIRMNQEPAER